MSKTTISLLESNNYLHQDNLIDILLFTSATEFFVSCSSKVLIDAHLKLKDISKVRSTKDYVLSDYDSIDVANDGKIVIYYDGKVSSCKDMVTQFVNAYSMRDHALIFRRAVVWGLSVFVCDSYFPKPPGVFLSPDPVNDNTIIDPGAINQNEDPQINSDDDDTITDVSDWINDDTFTPTNDGELDVCERMCGLLKSYLYMGSNYKSPSTVIPFYESDVVGGNLQEYEDALLMNSTLTQSVLTVFQLMPIPPSQPNTNCTVGQISNGTTIHQLTYLLNDMLITTDRDLSNYVGALVTASISRPSGVYGVSKNSIELYLRRVQLYVTYLINPKTCQVLLCSMLNVGAADIEITPSRGDTPSKILESFMFNTSAILIECVIDKLNRALDQKYYDAILHTILVYAFADSVPTSSQVISLNLSKSISTYSKLLLAIILG